MAAVNKLTKEERTMLMKGMDMMIASKARSANKEENAQIKEIREKEIQQYVILKNRLASAELEI